jgi:hypothetical protein
MAIGGYTFDPQVRIDYAILQGMTAICAIILGREVDIDELPHLYETDYTCRLEMTYVLCG